MEFKRTSKHNQSNRTSSLIPHHAGSSRSATSPPNKRQSAPPPAVVTKPPLITKNTLAHVTANRWFIPVLITASVVIAGVGTYTFSTRGDEHKPPQSQELDKLEYQTILPEGKTIQQLGGWRRVSPPDATAVFSYEDKIDGVQVNVSQQPLPDTFMEDTGNRLDDLAKGFNATSRLEMEGGELYVGTSSKGPQSAMLIKNGLLILIKSQQKIDNDAWVSYVESLQ